MIYGEMRQLRIGLRALVEAVDVSGVIAGSDAGAADRKAEAFRAEELFHERNTIGGGHFAEEIAGGVGKGCAEAENLLKARRRVDANLAQSARVGIFPNGCLDGGIFLRRG